MSEAEDKKIALLEQEVAAAQQMLYHVLNTINAPVVVTKESLKDGIAEDSIISVEDDQQGEAFVFKIVKVSDLVQDEQ